MALSRRSHVDVCCQFHNNGQVFCSHNRLILAKYVIYHTVEHRNVPIRRFFGASNRAKDVRRRIHRPADWRRCDLLGKKQMKYEGIKNKSFSFRNHRKWYCIFLRKATAIRRRNWIVFQQQQGIRTGFSKFLKIYQMSVYAVRSLLNVRPILARDQRSN